MTDKLLIYLQERLNRTNDCLELGIFLRSRYFYEGQKHLLEELIEQIENGEHE